MSVKQEHTEGKSMCSLEYNQHAPGETGCSFSYSISLSYLWIKSDRDTLVYCGARLQVGLKKHAGWRQLFMTISVYFGLRNTGCM